MSDLKNVYHPLSEKIDNLLPFVSEHRLERLREVISDRTMNIVPVLENIYDRGNVSAVMRSAEAFGFVNFHIIDRPNSQFKNSNRVSQGTEKWIKLTKHQDTTECLTQLKNQGFKIYATHLDATIGIEEIDFTRPSVIILGNEKDGVSKEALDMSDHKFMIPMFGFAQSFNISVAGALCFYHIHNYRKQKLGHNGDLSNQQIEEFTLEYLCKSIKAAEKILDKPQQKTT